MHNYTIHAQSEKSQINRNIYGHFAEHLGRCIYEGIYVGADSPIPNTDGIRNDVLDALRQLNIPVLRWPGGCFADEYHWKDGIGPQAQRKTMINTHWGGVVEDNSFGTHEFLRLCELLDCEPYICGNVGSGTVREMSEWVEYITLDGASPMTTLRQAHGRPDPWPLKYFGVGNENWGCGGNMRVEYYADVYRRYQTYVRNYGENKIYRIACGASDGDIHWTKVMMERAAEHMDGLSLHHYSNMVHAPDLSAKATVFTPAEYYAILRSAADMEELLVSHSAVMDQYDPDKRVALIVDEWGTWYDVEDGTHPGFLYQQNTMRDAIVAGMNLNIFNKHSDRVRMANIAQTVNVLQAMILTEGQRMVKTPTYHVFDLYQTHFDNMLLDSMITNESVGEYAVPALYESASKDADERIVITLVNTDLDADREVDAHVLGARIQSIQADGIIHEMTAHNTFDHPDNVAIQSVDMDLTDDGFRVMVPACSVLRVILDCDA